MHFASLKTPEKNRDTCNAKIVNLIPNLIQNVNQLRDREKGIEVA